MSKGHTIDNAIRVGVSDRRDEEEVHRSPDEENGAYDMPQAIGWDEASGQDNLLAKLAELLARMGISYHHKPFVRASGRLGWRNHQ